MSSLTSVRQDFHDAGETRVRILKDQTFDSFDDRDSTAMFCDIEFQRCYFDNCGLSITHNPALRSTFRNVRIINCSQKGSTIGCGVFEGVLLDGFKTNEPFFTHGAVFKHVVLRGKIDSVVISNKARANRWLNPPFQDEPVLAFKVANAEYYRHVDWALDISQGEFKELDIRGVPGHLIRRDPETQILVTRQRVLEKDWRDLEFREPLAAFSLDFMLKEGYEDMVMIAPKRHRKFPNYLADLQLLRDEGIAEPD